MPNATALILLGATLPLSYMVVLFGDRWFHDRVDAVITGVVRGVPVSSRHRWLLLTNSLLTHLVALVAYCSLVAFFFAQLGTNVSEPGIKWLAYTAAIVWGVGVAIYLVLGPSFLVHLVSTLRATDAE